MGTKSRGSRDVCVGGAHSAAHYRCGGEDAGAGSFWADGRGECCLGDTSRAGGEALADLSSEVADLLGLWELSERSLRHRDTDLRAGEQQSPATHLHYTAMVTDQSNSHSSDRGRVSPDSLLERITFIHANGCVHMLNHLLSDQRN